jgi:uncharacterized Zn-finger protein
MARKANTPSVPDTAPTAMDVAAVAASQVGAGPAPETVMVRSHRIACDGVGGALGHPRVWLEMGAAGFVDCPYCDRRFVASTAVGDEDERLAPGVYEGAAGH